MASPPWLLEWTLLVMDETTQLYSLVKVVTHEPSSARYSRVWTLSPSPIKSTMLGQPGDLMESSSTAVASAVASSTTVEPRLSTSPKSNSAPKNPPSKSSSHPTQTSSTTTQTSTSIPSTAFA